MSEYIRGTYGPGDIAALPPTIGAGGGGPTIGAEDVGHRIRKAFPFHQRRIPGATMVEAAGVQYPKYPKHPKYPMSGMGNNGIFANGGGVFNGMGTNENGNGSGMPAWALPVGIGLVLGGLYVMFSKERKHGGILPNGNPDRQLIRASGIGDLGSIKSLLNAGANVHAEDDAALREAAYYGNIAAVKLLLEAGADVHARNDAALRGAERNGHDAVVQLLEDWIGAYGYRSPMESN
jgi:hypothetical protein